MDVHEPCRKEIIKLIAERDALKDQLAEERAVNTLMAGELIKKRMESDYLTA